MTKYKTRVMLLANDKPPYHVDIEHSDDDIPPPHPPPPYGRINEWSAGVCPHCGSSLKSRWFRAVGCIQPECKNYHKDVNPSLWERFKRKLQ